MSEEITITKEDLVLWLDRPPSNDDLDLCEYLANVVQNRQKYYEENQHLKESYCNRTDCSGRLHDSRKYPSVKQQLDLYKSVLDEIRECLDFAKTTIEYGRDYSNIGYNFLISAEKIVEILDKAKE